MALMIYTDVLQLTREMRGVLGSIGKHDADLARQTRRALTSIALNVAEGAGVRGGNRRLRYESALGSAREVVAVCDIAEALGHAKVSAEIRRMLGFVIGTLVNCVR